MMLKYYAYLTVAFLSLCGITLNAQQTTKITGTVIDRQTKEALPFVNIRFTGTTIGTTSDFDGNFILETRTPVDSIEASYLSYQTQKLPISTGTEQTINFRLTEASLELQTVVITAKKGKYRKKNNPAVELIRKVIDNKKDNRLESFDYYEHNVYEKIEIDLNNITEKFKNRRVLRKMDFIFDYIDSTSTDKPFLPVYFQESFGRIFYRKNPSSKTEFREGQKLTELASMLDDESLTNVMAKLYEDVNIYDNNIELVTRQFVSPLSFIAPDFYRFYINDTLQYKGKEVIDLSFIPRNKQSLGFLGRILVAQDSTYRVIKAEMEIVKDINLNFVQDIKIDQEFEDVGNDIWVVARNNTTVEYGLTKKGMGFYGRRTVLHKDFVFNQPADDDKYGETENIVLVKKAKKQTDDFWKTNRPEELSEQEAGTYYMMDTLQRVPAFKRMVNVISFLLTGYTSYGPVDVGPINAFYSFNDVEGFRPRFGGRTNTKFHPKLMLEGYLAYGVNDKKFKYQAQTLWSFNENFDEYPRNFVRFSAEQETRFPGQELRFFNEDNFFLSFRRGTNTRMLLHNTYTAEYFQETRGNMTFNISLLNRRQRPYGSLEFEYQEPGQDTPSFREDIQTTELGFLWKWAPNAQYWNGKQFRIAMFNKYPIFSVMYQGSLSGIAGSDYTYHKVDLKIFKRFYLSVLGYSNLEVEAGKTFGKGLPYLLLHVPRANQSFAYQIFSFNLLNFLEFNSDEYVTWNYEHYFSGFFFDKIPLLRKLKLREVISFKGLYGRLTDPNNPSINPELIQFEKNDAGEPITFTLEDKPYIEASVGVSNVFKFLRIDLVRRLTYLDHPDVVSLWGVKGLAIRGRFKVSF